MLKFKVYFVIVIIDSNAVDTNNKHNTVEAQEFC